MGNDNDLVNGEYYMSYEDIKNFIHPFFDEQENDNYNEVILLAALTDNHYDMENRDTHNEDINNRLVLWENQLKNPSELVIGRRYFSISGLILTLAINAITSGALEAFISHFKGETITSVLTIGSNVVMAVCEWFHSVVRLNDKEFCVYLHAISNYKSHKYFNIKDLELWLPNERSIKCNISNNKQGCQFQSKNKECTIVESKKEMIISAIDSLLNKNIIKKRGVDEYYIVF